MNDDKLAYCAIVWHKTTWLDLRFIRVSGCCIPDLCTCVVSLYGRDLENFFLVRQLVSKFLRLLQNPRFSVPCSPVTATVISWTQCHREVGGGIRNKLPSPGRPEGARGPTTLHMFLSFSAVSFVECTLPDPSPCHSATDSLSDLLWRFLVGPPLLGFAGMEGGPIFFFYRGREPPFGDPASIYVYVPTAAPFGCQCTSLTIPEYFYKPHRPWFDIGASDPNET